MSERLRELTKPNDLPTLHDNSRLLKAAGAKARDEGSKHARKKELAPLIQAKNAITVVSELSRNYVCFACGKEMDTSTSAETLSLEGQNLGMQSWCLECLIDAERFGKCVVEPAKEE